MILVAMMSYILMIGAMLMAIGLSVNAIWRAIMPPAGLPRDGAACGSCGYELVSLAEGRCSECGADLLKSGVNTRHTMVRVAGSLPAAVMGWSVIMIIITSVIFGIGATVSTMGSLRAAGGTQSVVVSQKFTPGVFDRDGSGQRVRSADYRVGFVFDGDFDWSVSPQAQSGTVTVEVLGGDVTTELELVYTIETDSYTITAEDGTVIDSGTGYKGADAENLLAQAGLDPSDPGIAIEAVQVGEFFDSLLDDPTSAPSNFSMNTTMPSVNAGSNPVGGLTSASSNINYGGTATSAFATSSTETIVAGILFVFCGLLYVGGLIFIVRRRSKIIARPRAA